MSDDQGIIPDHGIAAMIEAGAVRIGAPLVENQVQPASLDLRLGRSAFRVRASFLPGRTETVADKLDRFALHEFGLEGGAVLETGCVYIVPLLEGMALAADIAASANPKSSTGRIDVFTRVITDRAIEFDKVPAGYQGPLYLEISPRTFPILVRTGSRLSQIRFRRGNTMLDGPALHALHDAQTLVSGARPNITAGGVAVSVDLEARQGSVIGYRAKRHTGLVDVDVPGRLAAEDFWEPLTLSSERALILDPDEFYILVSAEAVHVPPMHAAEMTPFDPLVGEFRVHYAGFFDPGFGHGEAGGAGSRAVLEVRSHEVPFVLEHGQTVGRLVYERMQSRPSAMYGADLGSNYQAQGLKLSKHFRSF